MKDFLEIKKNVNSSVFIKRLFFIILTLSFSIFLVSSFHTFDVSATNVLTNPSFTGGTTGWTLSGNMAYSTSYQDSAGSVGVAATGRNAVGSGTATQTISTSIEAGSTVNLSFYWMKNCDLDPTLVGDEVCTINDIYVRVKYGTSTYYEWSNTSINATNWTNVNNNISSYITSTGTYTFEIYLNVKSGNNKSAEAGASIDNINLDVTPPSITISTTGTQVSSIQQNTLNAYIGGAFTFLRNTSSTSVTSITVSETGTISDANISGLILYYKQEATCSTSIPGDATVFNSTPGSFSSGSSTVTGTMTVGTSQICVYVEADIGSGAQVDDTVEIQLTNPSTQITASAGSVSPSSAVAIAGTSTIVGAQNSAPSFTAFNNDGQKNPGTTITFTTTASDPNSDNIFLVVCKTAGLTGTACDGGAGDTLCTSSSVASNPSCGYSIPSVTPDTTYNSYPYVFDSNNAGSESSNQGSLFTYTVNNVAHNVSAVTINGGASINLEVNTTKVVTLTATVTDNNSCYGSELTTIYGYAYRSGKTYTGCDTVAEADNNSCYPEITCTVVGGTCTDNTDASADYTCTTNIQYYADPTDTNTQYPTETWLSTIKAIDDDSATGNVQVSAGVELNSLIGFSITSSINYGSLGIGQSNNPLDRTTTLTATGNVGLDQELSGSASMCTDYPTCSGGTPIAVGYQKYALTSSTAYSSGTTLSTTPTTSLINVLKPTSATTQSKNTWWGILIPSGTNGGSYNGNITITGIKSNPLYWGGILAPDSLQMASTTFASYNPPTLTYCETGLVSGSAIFKHSDTSEEAISYEVQFNAADIPDTYQHAVKRDFVTPTPANTRSENITILSGSEYLPQGSYTWKIRMWDSLNNISEWSTPLSFTCGDTQGA